MHPTTRPHGGPYKEVRGLARGLQVLKAMNRLPGGIGSTTELARACMLDPTTTKRLLETLPALAQVQAVKAPALLVVGTVVQLQPALARAMSLAAG